METNQHIFNKKSIKIEEHRPNIGVKQELDEQEHSMNVVNNLIGEKNGTSPIKQEAKVDLNTYITVEEYNASIKQESNIDNIENKLNYSNRNRKRRTKFRGYLLHGKNIKTQDHFNGIIICAVCGNLYTKPAEYFNHYAVKHSSRNKKVCKTQLNRKDTGNLININEKVKYGTGIVKYEVKEELQETKNCAQFNGIDIYKLNSHEIVENSRYTYEKQFKCSICSKSFSQKNHLDSHLKSHTEENPFKCEICSKYFPFKSSLEVHMRRHTGEKPFKCDVCLKSYTQRGSLNIHSRSHMGEQPFKCEICLISFSLEHDLNKHLRCHMWEKPIKCSVCLKGFSQKNDLKKHLRSHTGERPFKCDVCLKRFSQNCNLKKHLLCHTGEKPFKCDICLKSFSQNGCLKRHLHCHTSVRGHLLNT